jgi:hypothetical protein
MVLRVLHPDDAAEAATLLTRAAELDDAQLALFLTAFAERVRSSDAPVRAAEVRTWLDASPPAGEAPPPRS